MLSLNDAIEKCKKEELIKGSIAYNDNIPYSTDGIYDKNKKYCLLKAIEGLVTDKDIITDKDINCNTEIFRLLKNYIFNNSDVEKLQIDDRDVDGLIELRLIVSAESSYIESLDKLMFRIYLEKEKYELKGLIYEIYEKYDWAKVLIEKCQDKEKTIIFQENAEGYNERFGINQNNENDDKMQQNVESQEKKEENWILKKFGG